MRYVVADANVLARALIKTTGSDAKIAAAAVAGKIKLCFSLVSLQEVKRIINYPRIKKKYLITPQQQEIFLNNLTTFGKLIVPRIKINICRDKMDNEILSVAATLAQNRQIWLVTGDKDILVLKGKIPGVEILTAGEFITIIRN